MSGEGRGFITRRRERAVAAEMDARLAIKLSDPEAPVESLSGGHQQKVAIGKGLGAQPGVMLYDEPS